MAILVLKSIKLSGLFQSLIEADLGQTVCLHKLVLASLSSTDDLEEPDPRPARGDLAGEHPQAGADLQHRHTRLRAPRLGDGPQDIAVDQEVLAELAVRP